MTNIQENAMLQKRLASLEKLAEEKPMLADACRFYASLYQLSAEAKSFAHVIIDDSQAAQRLANEFPLVGGAQLQVMPEEAKLFFDALINLLRQYGQQKQDELMVLQSALQGDKLDLELLLRAALDREHGPVRTAAEAIHIPSAILEYCLTTVLGVALQQCRMEGLKMQETPWSQGYCPICGGLPVIAELRGKEGEKFLHCGVCRNSWIFQRLICIHCGNSDQKSLAYFTSQDEAGYRVDICHECGGYMKVVDRRERGEGLDLEIEDIASLHLDLLAAKEGFVRGKKDLNYGPREEKV